VGLEVAGGGGGRFHEWKLQRAQQKQTYWYSKEKSHSVTGRSTTKEGVPIATPKRIVNA